MLAKPKTQPTQPTARRHICNAVATVGQINNLSGLDHLYQLEILLLARLSKFLTERGYIDARLDPIGAGVPPLKALVNSVHSGRRRRLITASVNSGTVIEWGAAAKAE